MRKKILEGNIIDVVAGTCFYGAVTIENGKIEEIENFGAVRDKTTWVMPGLVDAHVHVESSMLVPSQFARMAVRHGTLATVSDPHEIANVLGVEGVRFMIEDAKQVPLHIAFGVPSCVPATTFETAGAKITAEDVRTLFEQDGLTYLSEMMNYPGVLFGDEEVHRKLAIAKELGRPIDGHAPGVRGEDAKKYAEAGPTTDHECFTLEEALDKISCGMRILIREGSAARNYEALHTLLASHPQSVMFCSDDKHPDDLVEGHINALVARSIQRGYDIVAVLRAATLHPIQHYRLPLGLLQVGDQADVIVVDNPSTMKVQDVYRRGTLIAQHGNELFQVARAREINAFLPREITPSEISCPVDGTIRVIQALDGEIVTNELRCEVTNDEGRVRAIEESTVVAKIVVVNRYQEAPPAVAYISGFSLHEGALASCVAHDSHNIVAVGVDDDAICKAVNLIMQSKGGISAVSSTAHKNLPLPVAGIMSADPAEQVASAYAELDACVKKMGCELNAPFMTLSFMALLVIPDLKLSDKGLFSGKEFSFVDIRVS